MVIYRCWTALGAVFFGTLAEFVGLRWSHALTGVIGLMNAALLYSHLSAIRSALEPN